MRRSKPLTECEQMSGETIAYLMFDGDGIPGIVDPNSTGGIRLEGWMDAKRGKARNENPYSSWCPTSLAEKHWFEGWDARTHHPIHNSTAHNSTEK